LSRQRSPDEERLKIIFLDSIRHSVCYGVKVVHQASAYEALFFRLYPAASMPFKTSLAELVLL